MNKVAKFTYYGSSPDKDRKVTFFKTDDNRYTCRIEGMHALTITHPSKERVREAFKGWWELSQKDWGASEIDWGDVT